MALHDDSTINIVVIIIIIIKFKSAEQRTIIQQYNEW